MKLDSEQKSWNAKSRVACRFAGTARQCATILSSAASPDLNSTVEWLIATLKYSSCFEVCAKMTLEEYSAGRVRSPRAYFIKELRLAELQNCKLQNACIGRIKLTYLSSTLAFPLCYSTMTRITRMRAFCNLQFCNSASRNSFMK